VESKTTSLKRVLKPVHVWALAVGLVISGEYFGWNYGWKVAGTLGFFIATLIVTVLYTCFVFSYTELTTKIPHAGGAYAYAQKAFGNLGGWIAGYASLVEFLLAPPAIALALGSYVHFLHPGISVMTVAIGAYLLFTAVNILGMKESAILNLIVTILAIGELLIFLGVLAPHFEWAKFKAHNTGFGWPGVFEALPFAVWLYLGIEGVAMVAEEVIDPYKTIPKGYILGILTLVLLAVGVMLVSGGVGDWRELSSIDYPLPKAIAMAHGEQSFLAKLFAGIGLFGLIASFHGLMIGYSRQLFALSRAGLLPRFIGCVNSTFQTPHWALIVGAIIGLLSLATGTTDKVIILSAFGAIVLYIISMLSLFRVRRIPGVEKGYQTPFYPALPLVALVLSLVCLVAMVWYNQFLGILFFSILGLILLFYFLVRKTT